MSERSEKELHEHIRENLAHDIADFLEGHDAVVKVFPPASRIGPLGGHKSEFLAAVEVEGELLGAMVVVYSDDNIEAALDERIEEAKRKREREKALKGS